mmetsp:Transcript_51583/g.154856  ORF Transcript_51583/g.154856 Transcript_51583/m.154856 type:complete len:397 (-) Transcript_51583:154-1344(-)|eukprot:CAMPEP_0113530378 /NCGR_PEP_ID=MMETSP0015_2-20120614/2905_1 /TAXON_ID=2838 /ORGANISM="Odontella" /LENGTH=396 /DNA_ID=CAMNT_0000429091 /DNA_START=113 /DNA_END=1303 /DNA_ORIENTATION=+ /assembly_acc=CAM_ASM_000160
MTDDAKIIENVAERLRFFFSDANVRGDKFMRRELQSRETAGFVPIETLLRFNSIKKHTTDAKVVVQAAKHQSVSDRVKLNDGETAIGRVLPFDREKMLDNVQLSLRVENLPIKEPKEEGGERQYAVTVDDVIKLFSDYGTVALVRLQRHRSNWRNNGDKDMDKYGPQITGATGASFVEFETEEQLKKAAVELCSDGEKDPEKTLEVGGNKLRIQTMKKWIDEKENKKEEKKDGESPKKRRRDDEKEGNGNKKAEAEFEEFKLDWKKNRAISLKGLGDNCDREAIFEAIAKYLGADTNDNALGVYADFSRGQTEGAVRFHNDKVGKIEGDNISEKVAEIAAKLDDGSIEIAGSKVGSAALLEGEEEEKYYKNFIDFKNKQRKQKSESKNNRKKTRRD